MGKCLQTHHTLLTMLSSLGTRTVFYSPFCPPESAHFSSRMSTPSLVQSENETLIWMNYV